jgi:spermidine synthase
MSPEAVYSVSQPEAATSIRARSHWIHLIVFASGFSGLGYEMVWTRMLTVSLGHEIIAVLAVLAAFFAGLALGAFTLNNSLRRTRKPHQWYALLEAIIGLWAIVLVWLIPIFNELVPRWIGEQPSPLMHWSVAFGATLCLLLPGTAAMGATLPVLERLYVNLFGAGRHVGGVYAANTFGAVAGATLTTFLLAPTLGYTQSLWVCAAVNVCCAGAVLWLFHRAPLALGVAETRSTCSTPKDNGRDNWLLIHLFLAGLLGLSYEVLVIRVLSQVLEDTIFTFALVLSIYLLGTACGAAVYQRWIANRASTETLPLLLVVAACASLSGLAAL